MTELSNTTAPQTTIQEKLAVPFSEIGIGVALLLAVAYQALVNAANEADRRHRRGELLQAYRRRRHWKKSDVVRLNTLPLNATASRRLARLEGTGRPVVRPHRELVDKINDGCLALAKSFDPATPAPDRLAAIKQLPWWPHIVEALYRGEYGLAKGGGLSDPSGRAERLVARKLGVSPSATHKICGVIRARRKARPQEEDFPPMTLSKFQTWLDHGKDADFWVEDA